MEKPKRLLSMLRVCCMVLVLLPATAAADNSGWRQAYLRFMEDDTANDVHLRDGAMYQLLYIDGDAVPELWIDYGVTAAGGKICTFDGKKVNCYSLWSYGEFMYIEKEGLFCTSGGHMDNYWDEVVRLENGAFTTAARGEWEVHSWDGPVISYTWNGESVSEEQYAINLDEAFLSLSWTGVATNSSYNYVDMYELLSREQDPAGREISIAADTLPFKNPTGLGGEKYWSFWFPTLEANKLSECAGASKDGLCFGMVLASMILNSESQSPSDFSASCVSEIQKTSRSKLLGMSALEYIRYLFPIQIAQNIAELRNRNADDLNGLYNAVKEFEKGNNDGVEIAVNGMYWFKNAAHSLWGVRTIDEAECSKIVVYDCNHPKEERYITLRKNADGEFTSWSYDLGLLGASAWGTGKSNAKIRYCPFDEAVFDYWLDTLRGMSTVGRGDFGDNRYLAALSDGVTAAGAMDRIDICGVVEKTEAEAAQSPAETLYWTDDSSLSVSGSGGFSVGLFGAESAIEVSSDKAKNAVLALDNAGGDSVRIQTSPEDELKAVFSSDDSGKAQTYIQVAGRTGKSVIDASKNSGGAVEIGGMSGFAVTVRRETVYADGSKKITYSTGCIAESLEPDYNYSITADEKDGEITVREDTDGDGVYDTAVKTSPMIDFTDVLPSAYYYDAVIWAVENGITSGTSSTTFSPDASCTRAQAVTFLWRAAGSPRPVSAANRFTDIRSGEYYYDAVLWAVEQGITSGSSDSTFSPNAACSRGQIVTFLYRAAGSPAAAGKAFSDVPDNAYYASAVRWAVAQGITSGTSAATFAPNADCTRGQIVTFLYRAKK